jgi:hypothetical protein
LASILTYVFMGLQRNKIDKEVNSSDS